jgi:NDP-sugar pyrophosphorylase family protein
MPIRLSDDFWNSRWAAKNNSDNGIKGALLAAGFGSRLKPLTDHLLPKPMFPLGGKVPISELWVRKLIQSGVRDISMNVCVLRDTLKHHFKDGSKFGTQINFVDEIAPSGTFGGVCKQALGTDSKHLPGEERVTCEAFQGSTLIVPSGDIVTNFGSTELEEMYDIHKKVGAACTIVLSPVPWDRIEHFGTAVLENPETRKGLISKSGKIEKFLEKDPNSPSNLNNASIYMVEMDLIKSLDPFRTEASVDIDKPFYDFGKHVFSVLLDPRPDISISKDSILWGIQYDGLWFDVGQKRDYIKVNEALLDKKIDIHLPFEELPWGYLGTDVDIDFSEVTIVPPVVIGNKCIIHPGATIGPYAVIGDGWEVGSGASIQHSVMWERYAYFIKNGGKISAADRKELDPQQVLENVTIDKSIITGGMIAENISEMTVGVLAEGQLEKLPIDWLPKGPRA